MKKDKIKLDILEKELKLMHRAAEVLKKSWTTCQKIKNKQPLMEEMDSLELLSSRFSRLTDFMIQRIFRLVDEIDLEVPGTVRDTINRAEKKGLIENADAFVEARILRNKIAHEYVEQVMSEIFKEAMLLVPAVLDAVQRIDIYTRRYK